MARCFHLLALVFGHPCQKNSDNFQKPKFDLRKSCKVSGHKTVSNKTQCLILPKTQEVFSAQLMSKSVITNVLYFLTQFKYLITSQKNNRVKFTKGKNSQTFVEIFLFREIL